MCGFLLMTDGKAAASFGAALAALRSRGPDALETLRHGETMLGHARLAVIDIEGGRQPMLSADGRLAMVYNGEIYNFLALRRELESLGYAFRTRSDSEVVLTAFQHWGESMLERLDGMFAIAIHDKNEGSVFLARDPLGIKPLFWREFAGTLIAASTMEPFFHLGRLPMHINPEGLRDYLAFQAPLAPNTLVREINALPPGHCLTWRRGEAIVKKWWDIPCPGKSAPDSNLLVREIDGLLARAVKDQLVADVPVGAFLSGGVDSSLIVHYMAEAGSFPIRTFSVRFTDAAYDESSAARAVAARYGTEHHELDAPAITAEILAAALASLDQPLADPAYVATWALSRLARHHVAVGLSGDGADELFGGYPRFLDTANHHPDSFPKKFLRLLMEYGLAPRALTRRALAEAAYLLYKRVELGDYPGTRKDIRRYLAPELVAHAHPEDTLALWRELAERFGHYDRGALLRADLWTYLSENCLTKTDRASMAHGLEVRVPFLARPLVERVLALPASVHFDKVGGKVLLRALAREKLPRAVWDRKKHGFSVPLRANLFGPWRPWLEAQLEAAPLRAPWINHPQLRQLAVAVMKGRGSARLLYTFCVLISWLDQHTLEP